MSAAGLKACKTTRCSRWTERRADWVAGCRDLAGDQGATFQRRAQNRWRSYFADFSKREAFCTPHTSLASLCPPRLWRSAGGLQRSQNERSRAVIVYHIEAKLRRHQGAPRSHPAVAGPQVPAAHCGTAQHSAHPRGGEQGKRGPARFGVGVCCRRRRRCLLPTLQPPLFVAVADSACLVTPPAPAHVLQLHSWAQALRAEARRHHASEAKPGVPSHVSCTCMSQLALGPTAGCFLGVPGLLLPPLQVRHMVLVETDAQRAARLAAEAAATAPRPPVTVGH